VSDRGYALVTGAGTGIGRAVAIALGSRDYEVFDTGRRENLLDETVRAIHDAGGQAHGTSLDVIDAAKVNALVAELASRKRLAVVVINAGTFTRAHIADASLQDWERQVDVNLTGAFLCMQAAIRAMKTQLLHDGSRGHIFTMNSGAGVRGYPAGVAYAASKHGLRGLVESIRPDAAACDIKITDLVISAAVESEMSFGRDVVVLPADTVAHTVVTCLQLTGPANWDRVDLGQIRY
jgi:NAD(P)-dependent dehydrogenase (short-subunit alcohol dehydrogenase family)